MPSERTKAAPKSEILETLSALAERCLIERAMLRKTDAAALAAVVVKKVTSDFSGVSYYISRDFQRLPNGSTSKRRVGRMATEADRLLRGIAGAMRSALRSRGGAVRSDQAARIADDFAVEFAQCFVGALFYLPMGSRASLKHRNEQIVASFTGDNHRQLAQRFNLCLTAIYKITQRTSGARSRQGFAGSTFSRRAERPQVDQVRA